VKPTCGRCRTAGLLCPGTPAPATTSLRWSTKHEVYLPRTQSDVSARQEVQLVDDDLPTSVTSPPRTAADGLNDFDEVSEPSRDMLAADEAAILDDIPELASEMGSITQSYPSTSTTDEYASDSTTLDLQESNADANIGNSDLIWSSWSGCCDHCLSGSSVCRCLIQEDTDGFPEPTDVQARNQSNCITRSPVREETTEFGILCPITYNPTDLVQDLCRYYFEHICGIFSSYDSDENPFRTIVSRKWQSSRPMLNAILSMSAAKLSRTMPGLQRVGQQYQAFAFQALQEALQDASTVSSELMLVILMLGLSASWHDTTDLGLAHLGFADSAIRNGLLDCSYGELDTVFFHKSLIYWKMTLAPAYPTASSSGNQVASSLIKLNERIDYDRMHTPRSDDNWKVRPHPWTGIAAHPQALFTKSCKLVQDVRSSQACSTVSSANIFAMSEALREAVEVESEVHTLELPSVDQIRDLGDCRTPAIHHVLMAEAYIYATLYQIYLFFPDILERRQTNPTRWSIPQGSTFEQSHTPSSTNLQHNKTQRYRVVQYLEDTVLSRLECIDFRSRTACLQPLLLLVAADSLASADESAPISERTHVRRRRAWIFERLANLEAQSIRVDSVQKAVDKTFRLMEDGKAVFWMDVLDLLGLWTMIG
jgi:hypothetical protein